MSQQTSEHDSDRLAREYPFAESFVATAAVMSREIERLATEIRAHYCAAGGDAEAPRVSEENPLIVVGILKGSFIFMADLCRALAKLKVPHLTEFLCLSSYGASSKSSGEVRMLLDLRHSINGRHVLVVEDVVDSGRTLEFLERLLSCRRPASLKFCVMLDKPANRVVCTDMKIDFLMMTAPSGFIVGGGLDWNEKYRNLPDIVVLKPEMYQKAPQHQ